MTLTRMSFRPFYGLTRRRIFGIAFGLCLLAPWVSPAQPPSTNSSTPPPSPTSKSPAAPVAPAAKPKSQYNTNIYEASDETVSFTDVVRVVRDYEGQSEVLFSKKSGVFTGPKEAEAINRLVESQTNQTPVTVYYNEASRQILRVLNSPKASGTGK